MTVFDIGDSSDRVALAEATPPQAVDFAPGADHVVKVLPEVGDICAWFPQGSSRGEMVRVVNPNRWVTVVNAGTPQMFAVYTRDLIVGFEGLS